MITLSIAEKGDAIAVLTETAMQKKGLSFCKNIRRTDRDYIFLPPESDARRDVLLVHDPDALPPCRADYVTVLNADKKTPLADTRSLIVTYGLNSLATVTASSIRSEPEHGELFCCVQRSLITLKGRVIEPQEFSVVLPPDMPEEPQTVLAFVSLGLILSLSPKEFAHIFL